MQGILIIPLHSKIHFHQIPFFIGNHTYLGSLYPDGLFLQEGTRKICEISFGEENNAVTCVARIKHPVSGMTVYELVELGGTIAIQSNTDDMKRLIMADAIHSKYFSLFENYMPLICRILTQNGSWTSLLLTCGCVFSKEQWSIMKKDHALATVTPVRSFFSENAIKVEWERDCDNELRVIALSFGMIQMVREAFPSLIHILKEFRTRRA
uniref:Urease accessory protein UreD n=1 Tax=Heterorhabditis bacteriophora TaxID=37862 RepID=A0A1I7XS28_HETBA